MRAEPTWRVGATEGGPVRGNRVAVVTRSRNGPARCYRPRTASRGGLVGAPDGRVADLLVEYGHPDACAAELLCDRHAAGATAFTFVTGDLAAQTVTYGALADRSKRFAAGLAELGVGPGTRVATLMGKSEDLVTAQLAIWRLGAVLVPLFTALASPAIAMRLRASHAQVVIVDDDQRSKLEPGADIPVDAPWRVVTR